LVLHCLSALFATTFYLNVRDNNVFKLTFAHDVSDMRDTNQLDVVLLHIC